MYGSSNFHRLSANVMYGSSHFLILVEYFDRWFRPFPYNLFVNVCASYQTNSLVRLLSLGRRKINVIVEPTTTMMTTQWRASEVRTHHPWNPKGFFESWSIEEANWNPRLLTNIAVENYQYRRKEMKEFLSSVYQISHKRLEWGHFMILQWWFNADKYRRILIESDVVLE